VSEVAAKLQDHGIPVTLIEQSLAELDLKVIAFDQ
jgi:hypothetical protein